MHCYLPFLNSLAYTESECGLHVWVCYMINTRRSYKLTNTNSIESLCAPAGYQTGAGEHNMSEAQGASGEIVENY